jgi:hypothetical protein
MNINALTYEGAREISLLNLRRFLSPTTLRMRARGSAVTEALRYNRKVAGSIPDGVIGIFH